jgi:diguanylate cyclase (GGDEF)-like protein
MKGPVAFKEILDGLGKLPTLPGIAMKILETVQKEETDLKEIADILSKDPPLSAEVLKIINSPFYGLSTKITSVFHAANMLGINTVKNLALSFSLIKTFRPEDPIGFNYTRFWKNSLVGAVSAKLITERIQPDLAEDAFFLGLLHNIGILTLAQCMPDQYSLVLKEMEISDCSFHEAENQILGFNHMAVGEHLVKSWGLPATFYASIGHHHQPENLGNADAPIDVLTKILHLASLYIDLFTLSDVSLNLGMINVCAGSYGFGDKLRVDEIGSEIHRQAMDIFPLFEINIDQENDYIEMIETARKELINLSTDFMNKMLEQKRQIEMLREQVTRDGMTQLINYQRFHELLHQEIYRSQRYNLPLSIIIADVDHFKSINDTYGHPAGDHAIRAVAACLQHSLRESDNVARYGGEEFAAILPETPLEGALQVAERLRETVGALEIVYEGKSIRLTMSFGVATMSPGGEITKKELIKQADGAMYRAKTSGRNLCCVADTDIKSWVDLSKAQNQGFN